MSEADFRAVVAALVREAKNGDPAVIRELLLRLLGRPTESLDPARAAVDAARLDVERMDAERDAEIEREDDPTFRAMLRDTL